MLPRRVLDDELACRFDKPRGLLVLHAPWDPADAVDAEADVNTEEEEELKKNLQFLGNQESLGICDKEIHGDDKIAWEHFVGTTRRVNEVFEVRMPFNERVLQLKSNIKKAAGRTRSE